MKKWKVLLPILVFTCCILCSFSNTTVYAEEGSEQEDITKEEDTTTEEEALTHKITYNLIGGKNAASNPVTYKTGQTITLASATKTGYRFSGWYSDKTYNNQIKVIPATSNQDIVLYAKWTKITYKITYTLNGGKNNSKNPKSYTVTTKKITLQEPTRTGYYFNGWFIGSKKQGKTINVTTGDIKLTAKWTKYSKKVYLKKNTNIYKTNSTKSKLESAVKDQMYYSSGIKVGSYTAVMNVKSKKAGFVKTSEITTKKPKTDIVKKVYKHYNYVTMERNLKTLAKTYPQWMQVKSLGKTADNRNIYCAIVGNPKAKKQIVVTASMHAREYLNTYFAMDMIEHYMNNYQTKSSKINMTYEKLFDQICLYIVPMVNPDGVQISMYGANGINSKKLRANVKKMLKGTSYKTWKANANGVNLNRNFPTAFGKKIITKKPGPLNYAGKYAASEKETKAIIKLYESLDNPVASIAYHSMGNIVDWDMNKNSKYLSITKKMEKVAKQLTGYSYPNYDLASGVGGTLGDWLQSGKMMMPNLTIETGGSPCPMPYSAYNGIWNKNKYVIESVTKLFYK